MIGLGMQEILVLLVLAVMAGGLVLFVVLMAGRGGRRVSDLEDENRRLRDENDRLRDSG